LRWWSNACTIEVEVKAVETAAVVAGIDVADVRASSAFGEVRRPFVETGHADAVGRYLAGEVIPGWEPLEDAVARFRSGLDALEGPVAVATHGTIVSAVVQSLIPNVDGREFWAHLGMPDAWLLDLRTRPAFLEQASVLHTSGCSKKRVGPPRVAGGERPTPAEAHGQRRR